MRRVFGAQHCWPRASRWKRVCADGVILGCTEITMLISAEDTDLPVFDTTRIHAEAAMEVALAKTPVACPK
jgi:aspartate/glutamate racemase